MTASVVASRDLPPLEGVAGEIEEVIGREATVLLIAQMRGATSRPWRVCFYVPKQLPVDHKLVRILGWHRAKQLSRAFGGEILQTSNLRYIERAWRSVAIWKLRAFDGWPPVEIAEELSVDVSSVRNTLAGKPPEGMNLPQRQIGQAKVREGAV